MKRRVSLVEARNIKRGLRRELDSLKRTVLFSLLGLVWAASANAQIERATLTGTVTDVSGASVPKAQVEIVSPSTGFERRVDTGDSGVYSITNLPIGTYDVTISHQGFKTFEERGSSFSCARRAQ